jgi:paired amphipathic helix protein Sin3a
MDPSESNLITVTTPSGTTTQKEGAKGIAGAVRQGAAQAASSASPNSGVGAAGLAGPAPPKMERTSISGGSSGVAANIAAQAPRLPSQPAASAMGPAAIRGGSPHRPSIPGIAGGISAPSPATPGAAAGAGVLSQSAGLPPHLDDPSRQPLGPGAPGADAAGNARTPLEFNHAINYVNKIKQRFSNDPETYKQFLEILQTYQKEGRAIQDVST